MTTQKTAAGAGEPEGLAKCSWLPYLAIGVTVCTFLEMIFFLEIVGSGVWSWPFIWAYSQYATLEILVPGNGRPSWVVRGATWFLLYVGLSFGLWSVIGRSTTAAPRTRWRRALLGWVVLELVLVLGAIGAWYAGIIEME